MNKNLIIGGIVVIVLGYLAYDYGFTKGNDKAKAIYDSQISQIQKDAITDKQRIKELELQLQNSASQLEKLKTKESSIVKENEKWKAQVKESKNQSLSLPTVRRLNSLLD